MPLLTLQAKRLYKKKPRTKKPVTVILDYHRGMPWGILRQKKSVEANSIPNGLVVVCLSLAVAKRQGTAAQDSRIKTCSLGWNREFFSDILRGFSKGNEIRCLDLRVKVHLQHSRIYTFQSFVIASWYLLIPTYSVLYFYCFKI